MRKIPREFECPLDDQVVRLVEGSGLLDVFYKWGVSPNLLTTIGNISRAISVYFLLRGQRNIFSILAFIGFFFDCFDGHYARRYNLHPIALKMGQKMKNIFLK